MTSPEFIIPTWVLPSWGLLRLPIPCMQALWHGLVALRRHQHFQAVECMAHLLQASSTAVVRASSSGRGAIWGSDSLMTTASFLLSTVTTLKASPVISPTSGFSWANRAAALSTSCRAWHNTGSC